MITREQIIEILKELALSKRYVHAMWLEGADGLGRVDEYSDIDVWFSVSDSYADTLIPFCIEALRKLGDIPYQNIDTVKHSCGEIFQANIKIEGTSPFLYVDICVQKLSRDKRATTFTENDPAEFPLVIFDKKNIIAYRKSTPMPKFLQDEIIADQKRVFLQRARAIKYIHRNRFIEAISYFSQYCVMPVVTLARLIYTPRNWQYGTCHISVHLPKDVVAEIERLSQNKTVQDVAKNVELAEKLFEKYLSQLENIKEAK